MIPRHDLRFSVVSEPKITEFFSPNAGEIALDQVLVRF